MKYTALKYRLFLCISILLLYGVNTHSQQPSGRLFIKNYEVKDFKANPQNWSFAQDKDGLVYFGNTSTVLEFDGTKWSMNQVKGKVSIRSVNIDDNGKIYVGAKGEIGYFLPHNNGKKNYYSLTGKIPEDQQDFADVWNIICQGDSTFFLTAYQVMIYYDDTITVWKSEDRIMTSFLFNKNVLVEMKSNGLYKISSSGFNPVSISNRPDILIRNILPFTDNSCLILTARSGLFSCNTFEIGTRDQVDDIKPLNSNANAYFKNFGIYCGIRLKDGRYAVGTDYGGVVLLDSAGNYLQLINKATGLQTETVNNLGEDSHGNLWVCLNNGISMIETHSQFIRWDAQDGLNGIVTGVFKYAGKEYICTSEGIYYYYRESSISERTAPYTFNKVGGLFDACFELTESDKILFAATQQGLFKIVNNKAELVWSDDVTFTFHAYKDNYLMVGSKTAVVCFYVNDGEITELGKLKEPYTEIRGITEDSKGDVWLNSFDQGFFQVRFDTGFTLSPTVIQYDTSSGLPSNGRLSAHPSTDGILALHASGVYRSVTNNENTEFVKDTNYPVSENNFNIGYYSMTDKNNNSSWIITSRSDLIEIKKSPKGKHTLELYPYQKISGSALMCLFYDKTEKNLWIGGSDGLICYTLPQKQVYNLKYNCLIRKVSINNDTIIQYNVAPETDKTAPEVSDIFDYSSNSVQFRYSATIYTDRSRLNYSYMLEGFDSEWSDWNNRSEKEYTNLPEGIYTFKVKANNIYNIESAAAHYRFQILPPWYRTYWAYGIYGLLSLLFVFLIVKLNSRRLQAANVRLEGVVIERTSEIEQQKEEIQAQADLLLEVNQEITQQKEEIQAQAENLHEVNQELEKLSIVARETDNAITISDHKGNIDWVNEGFERMYGFTYNEFIREIGSNILTTSANPKIKENIRRCIDTGESITYTSENSTKSGKKIWVQTTLTAILGADSELLKLIAIDSDISLIKKAEEQISIQHEQLQNANNELSKKNKHITDSIHYAQTIQNAVLPAEQHIKSYLPDSFIFFQPKDIVSGDFYWFYATENKLFFAVADCTGHGVPGAFMSMIGNSLLNEIVKEKKIYLPSEILANLNTGVRKALSQNINMDESQDDGMDISICCIDIANSRLSISLAGHYALLLEYDKPETIHGDLFSIGGKLLIHSGASYTDHHYDIRNELSLYMFSDGYQDQFGGPDNRKFMASRFQKMIESFSSLSFDKQKQKLAQTYNEWKGDANQLDDVLVVGIKIPARGQKAE